MTWLDVTVLRLGGCVGLTWVTLLFHVVPSEVRWKIIRSGWFRRASRRRLGWESQESYFFSMVSKILYRFFLLFSAEAVKLSSGEERREGSTYQTLNQLDTMTPGFTSHKGHSSL